ncbi:PASTA domain-containing protein [Couchioplanes caeruleus subsp. azureus]
MPRPAAGSDRTAMFPAVGDETTVDPGGAHDVTSVYRPGPDDATAVYPAGPDDATAVYRAPAGGDWADDDQIWAGRAGVRRPGPDVDATRDWAAAPGDEPPGKWWMPIVVGLVALLLLGVLSWGVWLIAQSTRDDSEDLPVTVPTKSASPAPTTEPTSLPPSTAPTTTQPSSPPPSSPRDVAIPALRGRSLDEARNALNRSGLNYRLRYVPTTDAPPGTVIDSDPSEGRQVPDDTIVNLIVAAAPTASGAPSTVPDGADADED